ncbi:MAG: TolC family protein [Proteobacteria bacterium]|nr:TolC family protein [Pseudomonadota bacterium]
MPSVPVPFDAVPIAVRAAAVPTRGAAAIGAVFRRSVPVALGLLLAGCAGTIVRENFDSAASAVHPHLRAEPVWLTTDAMRAQAEHDVDELLSRPLAADDAVRISLTYHPGVQAMLYERAVESASITRTTRLPNPVFGFERLLRPEPGVRELEITRALAFSLFDLIALPARLETASLRQEQVRAKLAAGVAGAAVAARENWVRAVAAQQTLEYARRTNEAADAAAELARRMHEAGSLSTLQRVREEAFAAEAATRLVRAEQDTRATREALVRSLGLTGAQAERLTLPERLPDLPGTLDDGPAAAQSALDERVDVRVARAEIGAAAREQGLTRIVGSIDAFSIGGVYKNDTGRTAQRGYTLEAPLPLFDFGDAARVGAQSAYLAALNRVAQTIGDAGSQLREASGEYRAAYDVARRYRDDIVPRRKAISDDNLLRYNAMLIGTFELLADAREQIASVVQAIAAQRDFWLADAAVQAARIGLPAGDTTASAAVASPGRSPTYE